MDDFNINKKRDQGTKLRIVVLCFKLCTRGVVDKIRTRFLRFLKMGVFVKSLCILFLGSDFKSILGILVLSKNNLFKIPKIKSHQQNK